MGWWSDFQAAMQAATQPQTATSSIDATTPTEAAPPSTEGDAPMRRLAAGSFGGSGGMLGGVADIFANSGAAQPQYADFDGQQVSVHYLDIGGRQTPVYWYVPEGNESSQGGFLLGQGEDGSWAPLYSRAKNQYTMTSGVEGDPGRQDNWAGGAAEMPVNAVDWGLSGLQGDDYEFSFGLPSTEGWTYDPRETNFYGEDAPHGWMRGGEYGNPHEGYGLSHAYTFGDVPQASTFEDVLGIVGPMLMMAAPFMGPAGLFGFGKSALGAAGTAGLTAGGLGLAAGQDPEEALKNALKAGATAGVINYGGGMLGDAFSAPVGDPSMFNAGAADALDASLIGPGAGAAPDSGSAFAPKMQTSLGSDTMFPVLEGVDPRSFHTSLGEDSMFPILEGATPAEIDQAASLPGSTTESTKSDASKISKTVQRVLGMMGGPEAGAPMQDEGESDEQYSQELAEYLSLDAQTLADQGLTPGSDEYYAYIMREAERVIEQVTAGMDVDSADFAEKLQAKTDAERQQLKRALHVRGQLDLKMGSGQYADPFTGRTEDVLAPGGMLVNPFEGAHSRGLARSTDALAGLRGDEAVSYLSGMLGRNTDLFDMQQSADARFEQAKLEDDIRRRRRGGMIY